MERFIDFDIEDTISAWKVTAYDSQNDECSEIEVEYWELLNFCQARYDMTKKEAINHLARCGEDETELLLKELFKSKYK